MDKQKVHIGVTESGQRGLFTGNYLAFPLRDNCITPQQIQALCDRCNFQLIERKEQV